MQVNRIIMQIMDAVADIIHSLRKGISEMLKRLLQLIFLLNCLYSADLQQSAAKQMSHMKMCIRDSSYPWLSVSAERTHGWL